MINRCVKYQIIFSFFLSLSVSSLDAVCAVLTETCTSSNCNSLRQASLSRATKQLMPTPRGRRPHPTQGGGSGLSYHVFRGAMTGRCFGLWGGDAVPYSDSIEFLCSLISSSYHRLFVLWTQTCMTDRFLSLILRIMILYFKFTYTKIQYGEIACHVSSL